MTAFRPILSLLAFAAVVACATAKERGPLPPLSERTTVRVVNQSFQDMTIYVVRESQRTRLGTVAGSGERVFPIPDRLMFGATSLRFQIDPLGGQRGPASQEITALPGDEIRLVIP